MKRTQEKSESIRNQSTSEEPTDASTASVDAVAVYLKELVDCNG